MTRLTTMFLLAGMILFSGTYLTAQTAQQDDEDLQQWNDVQLTVPMTKKFDFFLTGTGRITNNVQRFNEGRVGLGYVWKANKSFSVSPSYLYIRVRNSALRFRNEHRLVLAASYKFPTKKFGLSHRSQFEFRIRQGQQNSWRYRPSLKLELNIPERFIPKAKFFVNEEPFYVSTTNKFSRNRISAGISKTVNKNLSVDLYYLRQNDGFSHPGDLHVLGTSWKFKM